MRHFYGIDRINFGGISGDGAGQTIAIVDAYHDPNALSDLQAFDSTFSLPDPPAFDQVNQDGGSTPPSTDPVGRGARSWEVEESLDIQWAHAIAPRAALVLVETDSDGLPDLLAGARMAADLPGVVAVSMSFVSGESFDETSSDSTFTTPDGHNGVTFLAATGDSGSPGGYPAYSPNVVAVGGTTIQLGPGAAYGGETGWSGSGGGSSGSSTGTPIEPEPAYQQSVQNSGARQIPDVSMDADPASGVPVRDSYDFGAAAPWAKFGGTSLATPMWAALVAIADQGRASAGMSSLDGPTQTLPILYSLPQADFHDITSGSNGDFSAGPGYDQVTGLGSPVANLLVNDLAGVPPAIVPAASVVGRYVFYNDSSFDGNDPSPNAADDNAIASDKQALVPGSGPATAANYTSYSKGINGIMVDVSGLARTPTASDFSFLTGNAADPSGWSGAPAPAAFLLRPGAGAGGSTRIEITWTDGVIRNQWLQVTLNADANTGLTSPDVFYFGNLVGESDKAPANGSFVVTGDDELAARNDPHGFTDPGPITDAADYNKDGRVDAVDQLIARFNQDAALLVLQPLGSPRPTAYRPRRASTTLTSLAGMRAMGRAIDSLLPAGPVEIWGIPRHLTGRHRSIRHREPPAIQ